MTAQELITEVNRRFPPTTELQYKRADGSVQSGKVRFPAEFLESGKAVIWLKGELDSVELKNVILK